MLRKYLLLLALLFVAPSWGQVTTDVTKTGINSQYLGEYAYASLPSAANNKYRTALATDLGTNGTMVVSNGTRWRPVGGTTNIVTLGATSSNVNGTETVVLQGTLPINAWQTNDTIRIFFSETKSGTTDGGVAGVRIGTGCTTADTQVATQTALTAASVTGGFIYEFKLASATSVQRVGSQAPYSAYYGSVAAAIASPVTITSAAANQLCVSLTINSSGSTNTVNIQSAQMQLITP